MMKGLMVDENVSNLTSASGEISVSSGSRTETGAMYPQQPIASTNQTPPPPKKKRSLPGNPGFKFNQNHNYKYLLVLLYNYQQKLFSLLHFFLLFPKADLICIVGFEPADPDAEVIALSPKTLMAKNRFLCEICNKGFQRDQNLQLHRRGHNLPWKLKQRNNKEVIRKKVYVCPETTCVHHDPSRALGDLTGIKKHFCRKHGEKKWKCEKCSKRYAVQSDWKAHSKICGTREYRCDCGTLFSRRDSFITHRAFCDALAEESARAITVNPLLPPHHQPAGPSSASRMINLQAVKREQESRHLFNPRDNLPPWLACPPVAGGEAPQFNLSTNGLFPTSLDQSTAFLQQQSHHHQNPSPNPSLTLPHFHPSSASPHMSATALLQKAAQIGVTMSKPTPSSAAAMLRVPHQHQPPPHVSAGFGSTSIPTSTTGSAGLVLSSSREEMMRSGFGHGLTSFGNKAAAVTSGIMEQIAAGGPSDLVHDMMSSFPSASGFDGSSFDDEFNAMLDPKRDANFQQILLKSTEQSQFKTSSTGHHHEGGRGAAAAATHHGSGNDGLTRDFLGLKAFSHKDFLNMPVLDRINSSSNYGQQNQNQLPWQG
ncbi:hypothetical protein Tsubulata_014712 [Turnera subulata]|uniref:C2H2-type domain-containing protein n=1 Tax=Turnera subulata TaxID=218843 RepID=A0A9Q0FLP7_9ROSI|nr:hypothetical protein Tsubulata_014712 [Turnera subulata]